MNTKIPLTLSTVLLMASIILAACGPRSTPTPEPVKKIIIANIVENDEITGQIEQTKLFDQCQSASSLHTQIQFNESSSETTQKELVISAGVTGGADIPEVAKVEMQAAVEEHFSVEKSANSGKQETLAIEVPGNTRKEYKIIWNDIRRRGTIEYLEDGISKFANYSYRVGIELASSTVKDIDCSIFITPSPTLEVPTETPSPELASTSAPIPLQERPIAEGCIFSKTWQVDSTDADALSNVSINPDGCYSLSPLGISVTNDGALRFYESDRKYSSTTGIYTPITEKSIIEFDIKVNYLFIVYPENPAYISFAVAPAKDPITDKSAARFKLLVETTDKKPIIFFIMADAGEFTGSKLKTQHYEYGKSYHIRLELSSTAMSVYINGSKMDEELGIPNDPKVFYIGYKLPIVGGVYLDVTNIKIDGVSK